MGETTKIAWTDATYNPWRGCHKVSEGCKNCYAATFVQNRQGLKVWGQDAPRIVAAESTWRNPVKWNRDAEREGVRKRVFCASLADVFEDYNGPSSVDVEQARLRLFSLIEDTPHLDWLLLTKRPENMLKMPPLSWLKRWPRNVWAGCTAENQERADERIWHLLRVPAAVRFVSYEPALGPVDFAPWVNSEPGQPCIDWVIVGGESGPGARPFDLAWARSTVAQCRAAGVPVFVKQMGARPILDCQGGEGAGQYRDDGSARYWTIGFIRDKKGGDPAEWPEDLRIREMPKGGAQ